MLSDGRIRPDPIGSGIGFIDLGDGTRDELGYEMRCEAGSNIDEREIENS
jgi:hypothetical protein